MDLSNSFSRSAIAAYEALTHPVWLFSAETLQILASNRAAQAWLGYDAQTLQAMTIADLRPESERARVVDQVRQFDGKVADAGTWTIIARSGDRFVASFSWSRVTFEGAEAIVASIRDMTQIVREQAKTESLNAEVEALRRKVGLSHEHLSSLFDTLPGKILVLTPGDHEIVAVTDEYAKAVMADRSALLGRRMFEVLPDDPNDPQADGERNLLASLQRVEVLRVTDVMPLQRYPVRGPDGSFQERFWLPQNRPVLDQDGQLVFIIHRVEDVTELLADDAPAAEGPSYRDKANTEVLQPMAEARTAFQALEERETRLRTAEALLDLGPWEYDLERGMLSWSPRVFDIYGVPHRDRAPDFEGYVALVHPEDQADMLATYAHFIDMNAPQIEFQHRIIRADGSVAHIRGVGSRHRVEGREIVIGFAQDITRFVEAEEQLREAAHLQRVAGYMARLGSWRVDLNPVRITWSPETAEIHEEPLDKSPTLEEAMGYYAPEHRERIAASFHACAESGRAFDEVHQIITARGNRIWVRAIGEAVRNDEGEIVAVQGAFQDVSEQIAARDATQDLSRRLRETLESISDAFFLLDNDWRFAFLNSQAEALLRRRREELLGKVVWEEFPEAVGGIFKEEYERALSEGRAVRFQEFYAPLEAWFEINAFPTPEGLAVYFRDVTRERARDEHLRLLDAAVSRQNDILLITEAEPIDGPDGPKIVYVNDAFERRTGYSREEVIGKTPRFLQGPKTQRSELDRIRRALEKWQPVRAELINYTKSGEEFWLELDIVPIADETGWFTHWVSIERDITERKQAQQALQANEERFRFVAKATGNAIWEWDIANDRQWWSEGLRDIFGHEPEPEAANTTIWRAHLHPDDEARVNEALERLRSGLEDTLQERYRFRRADGSWARVEDRAFVVRDDDGQVTRVLGSITDVSEKLLLEERLLQAQKMESVGQLTGGVAHDFNNLLTVILGNGEILSEELAGKPQLKSLADMTTNAAARGAELTSRLLAFSRRQPLEPRVMDVSSLIHGMEGLLRRTLPANIDIEIIRSGGLWKTEVDPSQLETALLNLALNARDAMPEGGSLTIETANAALDDDYAARELDVTAGQYVLIVVTDTGRGIAPDAIGRVFEPFFTTKQVGMGTGLGLSMVYGFVKQSGGHIRVYSEVGEGTSFKLYFPRSRAKGEEARFDHAGRKVVGGSDTILVVEDDGLVREHVVRQLEALGYHVLEASTALAAMRVLQQVPEIDLLFTDVVMPGGMGGRELADAARTLRPDLKVLFTSGYTENSIVHNGRLDDGVDLLSKPYRREQLALKVRKVLDRA
ncbi:MAG: PAS domain S-box protein [Salinarimonas sp.]|nr:PAS domain S-box protein [Salinarimonas sp.]